MGNASIIEQIKPFMEAESVALIGVSRKTGPGTYNVLEVMLNHPFRGRIYPVNPNAEEILGRKTYPSVASIPERVDLAVIATPRETVPQVVKECVDKGIKALIVLGQGFADAGGEGKALQEEMVAIARQGGARVVGPNSTGVANAFRDFLPNYLPLELVRLPVVLLSQTGFLFPGFANFNPLGKGIDLANCCDVDFADCLEYFGADPQTKVILLHIEGIRDGARFLEVARRVSRQKPILALKGGRSQAGARAAQSHSGSLAGKGEIYDAVFEQCGIVRLDNLEDMVDVARAFLYLPPPRGRKVAVVTITGAGGVLALDFMAKYGFEPARLSPETVKRVQELSPSWLPLTNPMDIWQAVIKHGLLETLEVALDAVLADPQVDVALYFGGLPPSRTSLPPSPSQQLLMHRTQEPAELVSRLTSRYPDKPLVMTLYSFAAFEAAQALDRVGKAVAYSCPEKALKALSRLCQYYQWKASWGSTL